MTRSRAVLAAALLVSACGSSDSGYEGYDAFFELLRERTGQMPETTPITRAGIGTFSDPLLYAALPSREVESLLGLAQRNGRAETWMTRDNIALILRDGVLIGSRGLGEDLMSAEVVDVRSARGPASRTHFHIGDDGATQQIVFRCAIAEAGTERIDLLGEVRMAQRIDERCDGPDGAIHNTYWTDPGGPIRKSTQWVSGSVGYITLQRLID
jgi:hypothetical protein